MVVPPKVIPGLSSSEKAALKKKKHIEVFVAGANPELAKRNKEEADRKREKRKASGSTKTFNK